MKSKPSILSFTKTIAATADISLKPLPASLVFVRNCGSHLLSAGVLRPKQFRSISLQNHSVDTVQFFEMRH
jgi:hypothetical protein